MKLLFVSGRVPHPPTDGGRVDTWTLARALARLGHEVRVLAMNASRLRVDATAFAGAPDGIPVDAVDVDTEIRLLPAIRNLFGRESFHVARFRSPAFAARLEETLRAFQPDVVQFEGPLLLSHAPVVRRASRARVVLRAQNVESEIWARLARTSKPHLRPYLALLARRLERFERAAVREVDALVPIADRDAATFHAMGSACPRLVVPCGLFLEEYRRAEHEPDVPAVVHLGSMTHRPNQDGVAWLLDEVWPRVRSARPGARLLLGGRGAPRALARRAEAAGAPIRTDVADAKAFLASGTVLAVPLLAGGGMRVKLLEGLALRRAVVSTSVGAEGVGAVSGRDLLLADGAEAFAEALLTLLADPERARRLGESGRALVEARYDATVLARGLADFYAGLPI